MKAQTYSPDRLVLPCYAQPKKDGLRAFFMNGHFYSSDGKQWRDVLVAHILKALRDANIQLPLDGEFYVHGWPLQRINSAIGVNKLEPTTDTLKVQFHVFDMIDPTIPFSSRWRKVKSALLRTIVSGQPSSPVKLIETVKLDSPELADSYFKKCRGRDYEGAIYRMPRNYNSKKIDKGYVAGRAHFMLKRKELDDAEYEIVDMLEGKMTDKGGKHVGRMGALVCATKSGQRFNVGTGYSDAERDEMWKTPPIGKFLRVQYRTLSKGGIPLEPRSMGIRDYA